MHRGLRALGGTGCHHLVGHLHQGRQHLALVVAGQVGGGVAGVRRGRAYVGPRDDQTPLELGGEEQVGQLGLLVGPGGLVATLELEVVEVGQRTGVQRRGHRRHPVGDLRQQQVGQREGPEVVRAQLALEAVRGPTLGDHHDPGVVDQAGQRSVPPLGERAHRGEVGQVELADLGRAGQVVQVGGGAFALRGVTHRHHDVRAGPGQRPCGLEAETGVGAGDHEGSARTGRETKS